MAKCCSVTPPTAVGHVLTMHFKVLTLRNDSSNNNYLMYFSSPEHIVVSKRFLF